MKKNEKTIESEIENIITTLPEEVEIPEAEAEPTEPTAETKQKEPVKIGITDDAEPMKTRRRRRTKKTQEEPEPGPPVQILSGETLIELTSIITSRGAALLVSLAARQQKMTLPPNLTADFFALTDQEKSNLSKMADRAAEKMAASGDPVIVFFAGVLTIVGVKGVMAYQMVEAWNKDKK